MSNSAIIMQKWYPILRSERDAYTDYKKLKKELALAKKRSSDLRTRKENLAKKKRQLRIVIIGLTEEFSSADDPDRRANIADRLARSNQGLSEIDLEVEEIDKAVHGCSKSKKGIRFALEKSATKLSKAINRLNEIKPQLVENVLGKSADKNAEITINIDYFDRVHVRYSLKQPYGASASCHMVVEGETKYEIPLEKDWIKGWCEDNLGYRSRKRY